MLSEKAPRSTPKKTPPVWVAAIPVLALIAALCLSVVHFARLELTAHIALILATVVAAVVALRLGFKWNEVEQSMVDGIALATKAILILLSIGMLVGSWIDSGEVLCSERTFRSFLSPRVSVSG